MTYEQFAAEVETLVANLKALASAPAVGWSWVWTHDYSIEVCECAAVIGDFDVTFAKMFNKGFRESACDMMFERALSEVK